MSIILDALKKSESDQQRQSGPALFEVRVAPPKARFPVWAIAIVALLVINMLVVGYLLLRRGSRSDETAAANSSAVNTAGAANPGAMANLPPGASPGNTGNLPPGVNPGAASLPPGANPAAPGYASAGANPAVAGNLPPAANPVATSQTSFNPQAMNSAGANYSASAGANYSSSATNYPAPGTSNYQASAPSGANAPRLGANEMSGGNPNAADSRMPEAEARALAAESAIPQRTSGEPTLGNRARDAVGAESAPPANPDDYAPATEPESSLFKGHVKRGTESGVPLYQDLAVVPGANLPQLRLDLHVYAANPPDRFALINMRKVHEGDTVAEGTRVEAITPDGVVMSHNGSKFLLPRE